MDKVALQVIYATHTHLPRVEYAISHLRRDGKVHVAAMDAEIEVATIGELASQVGHVRQKLSRGLARKTYKHQ